VTPDETVVLARYVRALCPQQKFDEYTPDAWHDVLADYRLSDARAAAATVARRQPFVSPAEIIDEIKRIRSDRASEFQGPGLSAEVPDADPDDVRGYLAALRAQRTRSADGMKPRPVAELVKSVARALPAVGDIAAEGETQDVRRPGPLGVDCPVCKAPIGRPCKTALRGKPSKTIHPARRRVAKGEPAYSETPEEIEQRRQAAARLLRPSGEEAS